MYKEILGFLFNRRKRVKYRVRKVRDGYQCERTGIIWADSWRPIEYLSTTIFWSCEAEDVYSPVIFPTHEEAQRFIEACQKANNDLTPKLPWYTNDVVFGPRVIER